MGQFVGKSANQSTGFTDKQSTKQTSWSRALLVSVPSVYLSRDSTGRVSFPVDSRSPAKSFVFSGLNGSAHKTPKNSKAKGMAGNHQVNNMMQTGYLLESALSRCLLLPLPY